LNDTVIALASLAIIRLSVGRIPNWGAISRASSWAVRGALAAFSALYAARV
jgi:hypothetical protein